MGSQRGSITILGLIMILLLGSMGATLVMLSNTDLQIATNHRDGITAQYWAEAGIQSAVVKLKTNTEFVSETEGQNHIATADLPSTTSTRGSYRVQTGPDPNTMNKNARLIIATGMVNQAKRQIIAHITLPTPDTEVKSFIIIWNFRESE